MSGDDARTGDIEEYKALTSVLTAHFKYAAWARDQIITPRKEKFQSLTARDQVLLPWFKSHIESLDHSINLNESFLIGMAQTTAGNWGVSVNPEDWSDCSLQDLDKVRGIMIQYVREWSSIGSKEREDSLGRILKECESLFPDVPSRQHIEVLVPGAGLGRLVVEFVKRGFRTQGNEFSYHMLLNSSYILNSSFCENNYTICPFVHKSSLVLKRNDQLRQVFLPDFNPGDVSFINKEYPDIPVGDLMSMVAGSFSDLYGPSNITRSKKDYEDIHTEQFRSENGNKFHIVATCFFIDTASNIIDYLETINNCMKDDGYWINFGPLMWHYEDDDTIESTLLNNPETGEKYETRVRKRGLELSKEDLVQLIKDMGFKFIKHESDIETTYGGDDKAMGGWKYKCEYWVCQKE